MVAALPLKGNEFPVLVVGYDFSSGGKVHRRTERVPCP
jgi:hypothetical protein